MTPGGADGRPPERSRSRGERLGAASGAVAIVLLFVALFLPGPAPKTSDSVRHITEVLIDKRRLFLVGAYLSGVAALAMLWFLGTLGAFLRSGGDDDQDGLATTAVAGGVMAVTLILTGMTMSTGLALGAARMNDPALVRALTDAGNVFVELAKFGLAALVLSATVAAHRSRLVSQAMVIAGGIAGGLLVLSALSPFVADGGLWQFGGGPEIAGGVPGALWIAWLSVVMAKNVGAYARNESRAVDDAGDAPGPGSLSPR